MTKIVIEKDECGIKWVYDGNKLIGYLEELSDGTMLHFIAAIAIDEQISVLCALQRHFKEEPQCQ